MSHVFVVSEGDVIDSVWTSRADAVHRCEGLNEILTDSQYTWEKFSVDDTPLLYEV